MFPLRRVGMIFPCIVVALLVFLLPARGQDEEKKKPKVDNKKATLLLLQKAEDEYRLYFKKPETVLQYWGAMRFEMQTGKFDLAALHLKLLLAKQPVEEADKELLRIEDAEGMSAFLNLKNVRKWSEHPPFQEEAEKNVELLIDRVTKAVDKHFSDPDRLNKFINQLMTPTPEERAYAFVQLKRSRERAVPYLIEALRVNVGKPLHDKVREAMLKLDPETVSVFLEVFKARNLKDASDPDLRLTLLDIVRRRGDKRVVPYLWHLSSAPQYPPLVRERAWQTLAYLSSLPPEKLPPAKMALAQLAERYFQHKVAFPASGEVRLWLWDGQKILLQPVVLTRGQAEEFFCLRYAREALDLDKGYKPAQVVFLNMMLERTFGPRLAQMHLEATPPAVQKLLATIDAELITAVLERAMDEQNFPIILATVRALGERGDVYSARLSAAGQPRGLVRALFYGDRRVQFAAVRAMLNMPSSKVPAASVRVVDVLRRFLASDPVGKALVLHVPDAQAAEVRKGIKDAGFEPVLVKNVREAMEQLQRSADYDVILVHHATPAAELPYILAQLRGDADTGMLPLILLTGKGQDEALGRTAKKYTHVWTRPGTMIMIPEELKSMLEGHIKEACGAKLAADERKEFTKISMRYLWQMARGEIQGYDVRPAQDAIVQVLPNPELTLDALEILGRLPGLPAQQKLATVVLDASKSKLRIPAAMELNRHIQKHGMLLSKLQVDDLRTAFKNPAEDAKLREQLALVMGSLRPGSAQTGTRLFQFQPDPPPPAKKE